MLAGLAELHAELDRGLADADAAMLARFPGGTGRRQPVHTVYVPADQVRAGIAADWGSRALEALERYAPEPAALADAAGMAPDQVADCYPRVAAKLRAEPVEDLRVDLEDGYGWRGDAEEDADARAAAGALGADLDAGAAPPYLGVRMKGLVAAERRRGTRSLALFLEALLDGRGGLPDGFAVTLPKVTAVEQVEAMVRVCEWLERGLGLDGGRLRFELQIETPQAVLAPDGTATVARMVHAGAGRVSALHYGTYDYSAACGVTAAFQSMAHPAADHAKAVMQLAAAGTGVWLSDGSTNVLPVGEAAQVHAAWRTHAHLVRRSLERAFYQGWDLHPHQLPTRYLATYVFYREAFGPAAERLRAYLGSVGGAVLDEPATAQALSAALVRGLQCGALEEAEVSEAAGTSVDKLYDLANRRVG